MHRVKTERKDIKFREPICGSLETNTNRNDGVLSYSTSKINISKIISNNTFSHNKTPNFKISNDDSHYIPFSTNSSSYSNLKIIPTSITYNNEKYKNIQTNGNKYNDTNLKYKAINNQSPKTSHSRSHIIIPSSSSKLVFGSMDHFPNTSFHDGMSFKSNDNFNIANETISKAPTNLLQSFLCMRGSEVELKHTNGTTIAGLFLSADPNFSEIALEFSSPIDATSPLYKVPLKSDGTLPPVSTGTYEFTSHSSCGDNSNNYIETYKIKTDIEFLTVFNVDLNYYCNKSHEPNVVGSVKEPQQLVKYNNAMNPKMDTNDIHKIKKNQCQKSNDTITYWKGDGRPPLEISSNNNHNNNINYIDGETKRKNFLMTTPQSGDPIFLTDFEISRQNKSSNCTKQNPLLNNNSSSSDYTKFHEHSSSRIPTNHAEESTALQDAGDGMVLRELQPWIDDEADDDILNAADDSFEVMGDKQDVGNWAATGAGDFHGGKPWDDDPISDNNNNNQTSITAISTFGGQKFKNVRKSSAGSITTPHPNKTTLGAGGRNSNKMAASSSSTRRHLPDDLYEFPSQNLDMALGSGTTGGRRGSSSQQSSLGWHVEEMFETNHIKFGYKTSYTSSLKEYTTELKAEDTPEYREKEKLAAKLAAEIEGSLGYQKRIQLENDDEERELEENQNQVTTNNTEKESEDICSFVGRTGTPLHQRGLIISCKTTATTTITTPDLNTPSATVAAAAAKRFIVEEQTSNTPSFTPSGVAGGGGGGGGRKYNKKSAGVVIYSNTSSSSPYNQQQQQGATFITPPSCCQHYKSIAASGTTTTKWVSGGGRGGGGHYSRHFPASGGGGGGGGGICIASTSSSYQHRNSSSTPENGVSITNTTIITTTTMAAASVSASFSAHPYPLPPPVLKSNKITLISSSSRRPSSPHQQHGTGGSGRYNNHYQNYSGGGSMNVPAGYKRTPHFSFATPKETAVYYPHRDDLIPTTTTTTSMDNNSNNNSLTLTTLQDETSFASPIYNHPSGLVFKAPTYYSSNIINDGDSGVLLFDDNNNGPPERLIEDVDDIAAAVTKTTVSASSPPTTATDKDGGRLPLGGAPPNVVRQNNTTTATVVLNNAEKILKSSKLNPNAKSWTPPTAFPAAAAPSGLVENQMVPEYVYNDNNGYDDPNLTYMGAAGMDDESTLTMPEGDTLTGTFTSLYGGGGGDTSSLALAALPSNHNHHNIDYISETGTAGDYPSNMAAASITPTQYPYYYQPTVVPILNNYPGVASSNLLVSNGSTLSISETSNGGGLVALNHQLHQHHHQINANPTYPPPHSYPSGGHLGAYHHHQVPQQQSYIVANVQQHQPVGAQGLGGQQFTPRYLNGNLVYAATATPSSLPSLAAASTARFGSSTIQPQQQQYYILIPNPSLLNAAAPNGGMIQQAAAGAAFSVSSSISSQGPPPHHQPVSSNYLINHYPSSLGSTTKYLIDYPSKFSSVSSSSSPYMFHHPQQLLAIGSSSSQLTHQQQTFSASTSSTPGGILRGAVLPNQQQQQPLTALMPIMLQNYGNVSPLIATNNYTQQQQVVTPLNETTLKYPVSNNKNDHHHLTSPPIHFNDQSSVSVTEVSYSHQHPPTPLMVPTTFGGGGGGSLMNNLQHQQPTPKLIVLPAVPAGSNSAPPSYSTHSNGGAGGGAFPLLSNNHHLASPQQPVSAAAAAGCGIIIPMQHQQQTPTALASYNSYLAAAATGGPMPLVRPLTHLPPPNFIVSQQQQLATQSQQQHHLKATANNNTSGGVSSSNPPTQSATYHPPPLIPPPINNTNQHHPISPFPSYPPPLLTQQQQPAGSHAAVQTAVQSPLAQVNHKQQSSATAITLQQQQPQQQSGSVVRIPHHQPPPPPRYLATAGAPIVVAPPLMTILNQGNLPAAASYPQATPSTSQIVTMIHQTPSSATATPHHLSSPPSPFYLASPSSNVLLLNNNNNGGSSIYGGSNHQQQYHAAAARGSSLSVPSTPSVIAPTCASAPSPFQQYPAASLRVLHPLHQQPSQQHHIFKSHPSLKQHPQQANGGGVIIENQSPHPPPVSAMVNLKFTTYQQQQGAIPSPLNNSNNNNNNPHHQVPSLYLQQQHQQQHPIYSALSSPPNIIPSHSTSFAATPILHVNRLQMPPPPPRTPSFQLPQGGGVVYNVVRPLITAAAPAGSLKKAGNGMSNNNHQQQHIHRHQQQQQFSHSISFSPHPNAVAAANPINASHFKRDFAGYNNNRKLTTSAPPHHPFPPLTKTQSLNFTDGVVAPHNKPAVSSTIPAKLLSSGNGRIILSESMKNLTLNVHHPSAIAVNSNNNNTFPSSCTAAINHPTITVVTKDDQEITTFEQQPPITVSTILPAASKSLSLSSSPSPIAIEHLTPVPSPSSTPEAKELKSSSSFSNLTIS